MCAGSLGFSVVVFSTVAICTLAIILVRRCLGAQELGGNVVGKWATFVLFVCLYAMYLLFSILRAESAVPAFNSFMAELTTVYNPDGTIGIDCTA